MTSSNKGDEYEESAEAYPFDPEEDYFSPVEPISLSLEYHPQSLQNCSKKMIPPVRYLQCPAAVTVHHLKRFISSKFDIDSDNGRVDIEIIYEDEVLPEDFSLMDVGYCYSWKRITPMRFFYRILVHNLCNKSNQSIPCDSVLSEGENAIEAKRTKKFNEGGTQKSVRFKEINDNQIKDKSTSSVNRGDILAVILEDNEVNLPKFKIKSNKDEVNTNIKSSMNINNNIENDGKSKTLTNAVNTNESEMNGGKGPVKMTIFARRTSEGKLKMENNKVKSKSKPLAPLPAGNAKTSQVISDFKSLRSNDIRYSDYSLSANQAAVLNPASTGKEKGDSGAAKTNTTSANNNQKPVTKSDIVVCIPQAHAHRSSNSSDDSFENLSLAQLKTANKKISSVSNSKQNKEVESGGKVSKNDDKPKIDVPKLKIELSSLKTKISVPRTSPDTPDSKKNSKVRKLSVEEQPQKSSPVIDVDLTTYAKNIGLKPITPIPTERKKSVSSESASSTPSSASASSPQSSSGHAFVFSEGTDSPPHKKRKKGKHSKEPKEPSSKRRKLHAEISSQPADESLKLKVKITGNHRSYKAEKKASTSSIAERDTPSSSSTSKSSPALSTESVNVANAMTTVPREVVDNLSNIANTTKSMQDNLLQESSKLANRNKQGLNIPNLNKILSEESSTINTLIKENSSQKSQDNVIQNNVKVSTTTTKTKPSTVTSSKGTAAGAVGNAGSLVPKTQIPKKPHQPKMTNIQDTKIPISPPLPPSLFKTVPMTIPTLTPNSVKPIQPRFPTSTDLRPMPIPQMKRPTNFPALKNQGNFVVPNPPKNLSNSSKLCTITSIASSANRQAAQLKRSTSLDGNSASLSKQQKLDHGRNNRKSNCAPFLAHTTPSTNFSASNIGIKSQTNSSSVVITTAPGSKVTEQQTFYTSTMGPTYTREIITRKQMPIIVPPSSISVTKMTDVISSSRISCPTSSVTITPQQQPLQSSPFQQQNQKPALEIVRISSNIPPIDQQTLTVTNNNTVKQNPPKTTRPPPPPIPLVKIKRTVNQAVALKSAITTVAAPAQQSSYLSKVKVSSTTVSVPTTTADGNTVSAKTSATVTSNGQSPVCDKIGALDLSGKSSRSPSQEESTPTNTPPDTPTQTTSKDVSIANKQTDVNLQAALKKLSQQISNIAQTSQASTTTQSSAVSTTSADATTKSSSATPAPVEASVPSPSSQSPQKVPEPSNGLQNLKMLSESATSREKITIKNQRLLPMLPKLNEINKTRANPTVRHQNPSVRNIPNPSALAFRSQQPIPMLASITKTTSPIKLFSTSATIAPTTATTTATSAVVSKVSDSTTSKSSETSTTPTASTTSTAISSPVASSTTDSSKLKKNLHLEQLAASLNLRALSAAAADASKLSNTAGGTDSKNDSNNSNTEDSTTKAAPIAPPATTLTTSSPSVTSSSDSAAAVVTSTSLNGVSQQPQ